MSKFRNKNHSQSKGRSLNRVSQTYLPSVAATTQTSSTPVVTPRRKEIIKPFAPKLVLTKKLMDQINYMHAAVEQNLEWSCVLIYSNLKGTIDTVATTGWEILVEDAILMNIGTSGYTEYDMDPDDIYATEKWMDALDANKKLGHLHTHHNMACFFSGTDTQELHDNAPHHNYYLSLIVNYKDITNWCAQVAIAATETISANLETTTTWKGAKGIKKQKEKETSTETKDVLFILKCTIVEESPLEIIVEEALVDRVKELTEKKEKAAIAATHSAQNVNPRNVYGMTGQHGTDANKDSIAESNRTFPKPYSESIDQNEAAGDKEWSSVILDLNGQPIKNVEQKNDLSLVRGSIISRYSPSNLEKIFVKILDMDIDSKKSLEKVFMELELFDDRGLQTYMEALGDSFVDSLDKFFPENLTAIHLHAIACSLYDLLKPYEAFTAWDFIDDILTEHLGEEGEYQPHVIKQMTGLEPSAQVCLEKTVN